MNNHRHIRASFFKFSQKTHKEFGEIVKDDVESVESYVLENGRNQVQCEGVPGGRAVARG